MFPLECETDPTSVSIKKEKHSRKKFFSFFFFFCSGRVHFPYLFFILSSLGTPQCNTTVEPMKVIIGQVSTIRAGDTRV